MPKCNNSTDFVCYVAQFHTLVVKVYLHVQYSLLFIFFGASDSLLADEL